MSSRKDQHAKQCGHKINSSIVDEKTLTKKTQIIYIIFEK